MATRKIKIDGNDFWFDTQVSAYSLTGATTGGSLTARRFKVKDTYIYYGDWSGAERRLQGYLTGEDRTAGSLKMATDGFLYGDITDKERKLPQTTSSIYAEAVDSNVLAWCEQTGHTYDEIHELTTGDLDANYQMGVQGYPRWSGAGFTQNDAFTMVGQWRNTDNNSPYYSFTIGRGGLSFDISSLYGETLLSAKIVFTGIDSKANDPNDVLVLVPGNDVASTGMINTDYEELVDDTTNWGSVSYGGLESPPGYWLNDRTIPLNSTGLAVLNTAIGNEDAYFFVGFRAQLDINKTACTVSDYNIAVRYGSGPTAGDNRPKLVVYY